MHKKSILFIISNMESGGVSKSMSSLLNVIDTTLYDVDVFIANPSGLYMDLIPDSVTIIKNKRTQYVCSKFPQNLLLLLKNGFLLTAILRFLAAIIMKFNKGYGAYLLSRLIFRIQKKYDLAVDYNGQQQLYYLVDFINAKKKVSFFHSDYSQWDYYYTMDKKYFSKVDAMFTISKTCVQSLKNYFPEEISKIQLFENISSVTLIHKLSHQTSLSLHDNSILSIGHLSIAKGTPLALEVAEILKKKGVAFKWYFMGKDSNDVNYNQLILSKGLEQYVVFLGVQSNPYPYIKGAKIIAHLSKFEGKSIALDEAKILQKPVVVTHFSTVNDQFEDQVTATICTFDAQEIAHSIQELLENNELREKYRYNLEFQNGDTSNEINKLYNLIE